jgi:hypothetical protein
MPSMETVDLEARPFDLGAHLKLLELEATMQQLAERGHDRCSLARPTLALPTCILCGRKRWVSPGPRSWGPSRGHCGDCRKLADKIYIEADDLVIHYLCDFDRPRKLDALVAAHTVGAAGEQQIYMLRPRRRGSGRPPKIALDVAIEALYSHGFSNARIQVLLEEAMREQKIRIPGVELEPDGKLRDRDYVKQRRAKSRLPARSWARAQAPR